MKYPIQSPPVERTIFQDTISLKSGQEISASDWKELVKKAMAKRVERFEQVMDYQRRQNLDPFTDVGGQFFNPALQYNAHNYLRQVANYPGITQGYSGNNSQGYSGNNSQGYSGNNSQ
ncbi:MAG: hypothetical protein Fur0025_44230 [Oscillatoriaceae cyanobacterium]